MMKIINHVYLAIRLTLSQDHANFKNSHYQLLNKKSNLLLVSFIEQTV
jgi:hypothetical protein